MVNHYLATELFIMLKTQYEILACRTLHTNRKGWNQLAEDLKIIRKGHVKSLF